MKEINLGPNEHIVIEVRKHWFYFVLELLPFAIFAALPFAAPKLLALAPPLAAYAAYFSYEELVPRVFLSLWLLFTWTAAWSAFTQYYLDILILTNERLVDVDQRGYFSRQVSSLLLSRVEDVTTNVHGILASMLRVGTLKVQSAGASPEFIIRGIPHPDRLRDLILKYVPEEKAP